ILIITMHNITVAPKPIPSVLLDLLFVIIDIKCQLRFDSFFGITFRRTNRICPTKYATLLIVDGSAHQQRRILDMFGHEREFFMGWCTVYDTDFKLAGSGYSIGCTKSGFVVLVSDI